MRRHFWPDSRASSRRRLQVVRALDELDVVVRTAGIVATRHCQSEAQDDDQAQDCSEPWVHTAKTPAEWTSERMDEFRIEVISLESYEDQVNAAK